MSDNTKQFRWIVTIKENLEILWAACSDVFIAGDLLWYPIEGDNVTRQAPDVMVVFGRPKGDRGSYQQWKEDHLAPQVVFEILSPCNTKPEMERKRIFYETHGVEEYYVYDPDRIKLSGWLRQGRRLENIVPMEGWVSPRLGIRFSFGAEELEIYRPDGRKFLSSVELEQRAEQAQQRAEQAQQRAEQAEAKLEGIISALLQVGMDAEQVARLAGVSRGQVETIAQRGS